MNSLLVIHPYKTQGIWVFDDEKVGLVEEPFVSGADDMIDKYVVDIPNAEAGFSLIFSASPFPGFAAELDWVRTEHGGNWYISPVLDMEGWLCPALFKYFEEAPKKLFAQFRAKAV